MSGRRVTPNGGHGARGHSPELLERDRELEALEEAIDRAGEGDGSLVLIEAHAGLGKSRLLEEAAAHAAARGHQLLRGAGNELEREFTFGVVLQLFEPALPAPGAARDELFKGAAGLARALVEPGGAGASGEGSAFPLLHGLYWLTSSLAGRSPLLLAVDDLHWADDPSLRYLAYLSERLEGLPVVLVATLRPHEPGAAEDLIAALRGRATAEPLPLQPLGADAVAQLVHGRFPHAAPEFTAAVRDLTEGNPFLIEALLRGVEHTGGEPSAEVAAQLARLAPESVLRSVLVRIARLPASAAALARAAAVLAPHARLRTTAALASLDHQLARQAADALTEAELLKPGDPVEFVHPLVRAVVYDDLPAAERAAAHLRAARLLAAEGAAPDAVAAHLLLAERRGEEWTVTALERAAALALGEGSPSSAVTYLRRALSEPPSRERRGEVLLALGRAEVAAGEPEASERLSAAIELIEDPRGRAHAALELAPCLQSQNRPAEAAAALDRALVELEETDEQLARELEATWISVARLALPLREQAVERLARIIEHPRGDSQAERLLLAHASGQKLFAGDPREEACALARLALADGALLAEAGPDDQGWFIALATFAWSDDFETYERGLETAMKDARRRGLIRSFATAAYGLSFSHYYAGRLVETVADAEQAIECRHMGWQELLPAAYAQLAWALLERDELERAQEALSLPGLSSGDNVAHVVVFEARARLALVRGDPRRAFESATQAGKLALSAFIVNPSCLPWRSTAATAAVQLGEVERARELVDEELRLARRFGAPRPIGVALRAAGLVERGDAGIELLREAVTTLAESPARLEHARALVDLGAALRRHGSRAEAREPLREAARLTESFGALALERRARAELLAAGARPRRRELSGPESLTPSELRVAEMAASGMSNREIAQALFVTIKAIQWHLRNAYRKLEIEGRDQLGQALGQ